MKLKRYLLLAALPFLLYTCNDNTGGFTQVKSNEHLVYLSIKEYRESNGQTGPFAHQYLMVDEAQLYSYKMANGFEAVGLQGLEEHWTRLDEKFSFYNQAALVLKTESSDEERILTGLLQIPGADTVLLGDLTQCGVGIEVDTAGINYITILLAKVDS
ncbi:MAG: hypothetical protein GY790_11650 [Bacteroidetes bacterium]|nr:hypothetical protein [Bacteroidota bacterium]